MINGLVSVIIPTHNRADLIGRAIESVLKQTYKMIEIIVVSDGSTDNTKNVVSEYAEKDHRIQFIEYFPGGNGNIARNRGIEASKGEYIAFLDDDDEWMPNKLTKQLEIFSNNGNVGLVYTGVHIIYTEENIEYAHTGGPNGNLSKSILFGNVIGTTSTVLIKRHILELSGNFDTELKAVQDFDLWIRICQLCDIGIVREELINYYNYSASNQISSNTDKYIDSYKYIFNKYEELYQKLSKEELITRDANILIGIANRCIRNESGKDGRYYLLQAFKKKKSFKIIGLYLASFLDFKTLLKIRAIIEIVGI